VTRPLPDEEDQRRLLVLLRQLGATEEEIAATPVHQRSALALEVSLRGGRTPVPLPEAAAQVGASPDELEASWRALGFAGDPRAAALPAELVEAQRVLLAMSDLIGAEAVLGLTRVVGSATTRLAEAVVDAFRIGFEMPALEGGTRYSDVVESYVAIAGDALPAFEQLVRATLRAHLVRVAGGAWAPDAAGAAARRTLVVGFADLVGYTALTRTLAPSGLAQLLRRFEDVVADILPTHGGRLVKQIGDGVMFTADDVDAAAAIGLALVAACTGSEQLPPVRVGIDAGEVLTHYGDYYGDVVNLAARLVALAAPGTVVISEAAAAAARGWTSERLPDQALKGFGAPATVYRLVGVAPG
jgi:adenylate cyclase